MACPKFFCAGYAIGYAKRPITLNDLAKRGTLLLVWCRCGHRAELDAGKIPLRPTTPVPGIARRFRCTACGAKNTPIDHPVMTLPDPGIKGMHVSYPKF